MSIDVNNLPTRLACNYSNPEAALANYPQEMARDVAELASVWTAQDVACWEAFWGTTIDDDTCNTLAHRAYGDAIHTILSGMTTAQRLKAHSIGKSAWNWPEGMRSLIIKRTNQHGTVYTFADSSRARIVGHAVHVDVLPSAAGAHANPDNDRAWYIVEVTDTFNGDLNYAWCARYKVKARSPMAAITKVKIVRYTSPVPRHRVALANRDEARVDLRGMAVAIVATHMDRDDDVHYPFDRVID